MTKANDPRLEAARNPESGRDLLHELAASDEELIRAAVILNPATAKHTIDQLANDPSIWIAGLAEKRALEESQVVNIHPTAVVHPGARIGNNVRVGPFSIIHKNVVIGDGSTIGSHCEIGHPVFKPNDSTPPLIFGQQTYIRSHSIFYEGSSFGDRLVTGHRVTVREGTVAGENLQIGTLSDIQGTCEIGNFVRMHSNVHIGQQSKINDFVWLFPYVVLTNDPHPPSDVMRGTVIESYAAIATMSVILPGVTVAADSLVGAHSCVGKNVDSGMVVAGVPAKPVCKTTDILLKDGTARPAYPWRTHFHRGYPDAIIQQWMSQSSPAG